MADKTDEIREQLEDGEETTTDSDGAVLTLDNEKNEDDN